MIEYTSYADVSSIPGHYVLFWQLNTSEVPAKVLQQCCLTVEESLNSVYRQGRAADKSIGHLQIKIVESGTFDELMDYALSRGASINQYKAPRCVKFAPIVELLNSRVTASYFSPRCPQMDTCAHQLGNFSQIFLNLHLVRFIFLGSLFD